MPFILRKQYYLLDCAIRNIIRHFCLVLLVNSTQTTIKMRPLLTNHRVFIWLCMSDVDANTSKFQKLLHIMFSAAVLLTLTSLMIAGVMYAVQHYSVDLKATSQALVPIDGVIGLNYMILVAFTLRRKISAMFESLFKICEASGYPLDFKINKIISNQI